MKVEVVAEVEVEVEIEIEEEGAIIRVIVTAQKTVVRQKGALFKINANTERDVIHQTQEVVAVGDLEGNFSFSSLSIPETSLEKQGRVNLNIC